MMTTLNKPSCYNVAVIGGGISGTSAVHKLISLAPNNLKIHLFDQGRQGVGGRSSHRTDEDKRRRWDHGCQFFRADTEQFQPVVKYWIEKGLVQEWNGTFESFHCENVKDHFFGLPHKPPFFVGVDGMQSIPQGILNLVQINHGDQLSVHTGTRVSHMKRDDISKRWFLYGTSGEAAFHDTPEDKVEKCTDKIPLGSEEGFDAVILTDVSSSFDGWHRASAGVPDTFAKKVRDRVGARIPLFTAMIAFRCKSNITFDAATFGNNKVLWFASKSNSKPGMSEMEEECWTLVSTPEYAIKKIQESPMQDPKTGSFIPQTKDYLQSVPGPELRDAFLNEMNELLPEITYMNAQRWGSAMPSYRHFDPDSSSTIQVVSDVPYDSCKASFISNEFENSYAQESSSFIADEDLMLFQAGDMMSLHIPGFEGAALSGMNAAEHLMNLLYKERTH